MIVRIRVQKHGFAPPRKPDGSKDDWRTNVCIVDLLTTLPRSHAPVQVVAIRGEEYRLLPRRGYAWFVTEWDGDRP